jgi:hypothetical protein
MFNLEPAIAEWRRQMVKAGINSPAPLEELDCHLREEIERQMQAGMAAQPAFELAVQRVGQAGALKIEFKKISACAQRLPPRYLRRYCYIVAPFILLVSLVMPAVAEINLIEVVGGVLLALYTGSLPRWHSLLANPRSRLVQAALLVGGFFVFTWPVWAVFGLLPGGIMGNMIPSSILPAWFAMVLAYCVYCPAHTAEQIRSMSGKQ